MVMILENMNEMKYINSKDYAKIIKTEIKLKIQYIITINKFKQKI